MEIGVGSGRFAGPLNIKLGIEPSPAMRKIAETRGIKTLDGAAESLPLHDESVDFALMVTTICFLDDADSAFREALRVLKPGGSVIVGFVDRKSPLGQSYEKYKMENVFYRSAEFFSVDEVVALLKKTGFENFTFAQTVFQKMKNIQRIEPVKEGYGEGSFIVIRADKPALRSDRFC